MRNLLVLLFGIVLVAGCGPAVSEEELGQVVYEVPMVPGADVPYPIPELKTATSDGETAEM